MYSYYYNYFKYLLLQTSCSIAPDFSLGEKNNKI
jgi:hypothetical protein